MITKLFYLVTLTFDIETSNIYIVTKTY